MSEKGKAVKEKKKKSAKDTDDRLRLLSAPGYAEYVKDHTERLRQLEAEARGELWW